MKSDIKDRARSNAYTLLYASRIALAENRTETLRKLKSVVNDLSQAMGDVASISSKLTEVSNKIDAMRDTLSKEFPENVGDIQSFRTNYGNIVTNLNSFNSSLSSINAQVLNLFVKLESSPAPAPSPNSEIKT